MHRLIYVRFIGDGDSSVYKNITNAAPYGPQFHVEKMECTNHLQNYESKLKELSRNTGQWKFGGKNWQITLRSYLCS